MRAAGEIFNMFVQINSFLLQFLVSVTINTKYCSRTSEFSTQINYGAGADGRRGLKFSAPVFDPSAPWATYSPKKKPCLELCLFFVS